MGNASHTYSVCQMMATMAMPEEMVRKQLDERGWISVNDCACGAGATLIAAAERLMQMEVNYQQHALFVAQDLDSTVAMMCYVQMSLIGCAGRVRIGDTLMNPDVGDILMGDGSANTWYMPMFYSYPWQGRVIARWMDRLIGVRKPIPEQEETGTGEHSGKAEKAPESVSERPEMTVIDQKAEQNAQKTYQMPELLTAKKTRRSMSDGQLMFDLTGGM